MIPDLLLFFSSFDSCRVCMSGIGCLPTPGDQPLFFLVGFVLAEVEVLAGMRFWQVRRFWQMEVLAGLEVWSVWRFWRIWMFWQVWRRRVF